MVGPLKIIKVNIGFRVSFFLSSAPRLGKAMEVRLADCGVQLLGLGVGGRLAGAAVEIYVEVEVKRLRVQLRTLPSSVPDVHYGE